MFIKQIGIALGACAIATAAAMGQVPTYHATPLADMIEATFPGVQFPSSDARGLNENGDLVGEAWLNGSQMQGFVYTVEHGITPLPLPAGWTSAAVRDVTERDANGEIIIVGGGVYGVHVDIAIGDPVLWRFSTVTGAVLETRTLPIPTGFDDGLAVAVNNSGTVVGFSGLNGPYTNWKYDVSTDALETFDFPYRVTDLNNIGQVCGGPFRGDLFGNYDDLGEIYEPGDVMPDWAIDNGGISAGWHRINDLGWVVGRAGTGISDGAGHYKVAIVRFADPIGWTGFPPVSHLSLAGGINDQGDFMVRQGGVYLEDPGAQYSIGSLLSPESQPLISVAWSDEINNHQQIAGSQAHAFLLTPLGQTVIPGDITGDVTVDRDDYCAWVADPIDLNDDGIVDADDEAWLLDRLLVFGWTIEDCNANGAGDHCDILDGLSADCDENDVPDECQADCNADGVPNVCEPDCNTNGTPDPCDIAGGASMDCNLNGVPDECDQGGITEAQNVFDPPVVVLVDNVFTDDLLVTGVGTVEDVDLTLDIHYRIGELTILLSHGGVTVTICDQPGIVGDEIQGNGQFGYDITVDDEGAGDHLENVGNFGSPFEQIVSPPNYKPDEPLSAFDGMPSEGIWTLTVITSPMWSPADTFDGWGLIVTLAAAPVSCDCNANGIMDAEDIASGTSDDCDGNAIPDECELPANDCNGTGTLDACDAADGTSLDCNTNSVPDECESDCNGNGIPDDCDVAAGSPDCDGNLVPDDCDVASGDCNGNGTVDACDITAGFSEDCNVNGIPDECESGLDCDNDWCADALPICPGTGTGSTTGANRDGDAACDGYHKSPDVWYSYTPGSGGMATFSTCTSPYDTLLSVHAGCPGNQFNELACNDDACGTYDSMVTWDVTAGETYLIRVAGYLNASGDFNLTLNGPDCAGATADCVEHAECADADGDGSKDDGCMWWSCDGGTCAGTDVVFADMGGPFGDCTPDGVADGHDRFHALNCFADTGIGGGGYDCETAAPAAFNVDTGGPFGDCAPDGVCDGNDAFHAISAFEETALCSCPMDGGGPKPTHKRPTVVSERASLTLEPARDVIRGGDTVEVMVWFEDGLDDLRGYQLHVEASGGTRGRLQLVDMAIAERRDHVFAGLAMWSAFNLDTAQLLAGLDDPGVATMPRAYLATLTFTATPDAVGQFVVDVLRDHDAGGRTFLFPTPVGSGIDLVDVQPAIVEVKAAKRRVTRR